MKGPKMVKFSSLEKMSLNTNGLGDKMTILPSSFQRNHHHAITQFKEQECPFASKKRQCLKTWHENEWRTRYHIIQPPSSSRHHLLLAVTKYLLSQAEAISLRENKEENIIKLFKNHVFYGLAHPKESFLIMDGH